MLRHENISIRLSSEYFIGSWLLLFRAKHTSICHRIEFLIIQLIKKNIFFNMLEIVSTWYSFVVTNSWANFCQSWAKISFSSLWISRSSPHCIWGYCSTVHEGTVADINSKQTYRLRILRLQFLNSINQSYWVVLLASKIIE